MKSLARFTLFSFLWLTLFALSSCKAQSVKPSEYGIKSKKALKMYQGGRQSEQYRDYHSAIEFYQQALEIEPEFGDAWFRGGCCHYVNREYEEAGKWMKNAEKTLKNPHPMLNFYLGESAFYREDFAEALKYYKEFEIHPNPKKLPKKMLIDLLKHKESAAFAVSGEGGEVDFEPVNLGENINTAFDEYLPYLTADEQTIFFTARRPGCTGGYSSEYRGYTEDFFYSVLKDGEWQAAENLGPPVNTEQNEGAASFSPDGQFVFFTACNLRGGMGDCDLYVSKLNGKTWSKPENLGPRVNTSAWESQPCISNDGRTLYFTSSRKGGQGGQDIWYTTRVNNAWTSPQNLGPGINTKGNEMSPFLHADGKTFYFSSNKHPGFGGLDLFMSKKEGGTWSKPKNLGFPLNTSGHEGNIFINAKGTIGYINSTRDGGKGRGDIYSFELDEQIRPEYATYVRGHVLQKGSKKPLQGRVTFIDIASGDTVRAVTSNAATGKFLLTLPIGRDYAAFVDKKGYLFASQSFSLKNLKAPDKAGKDQYFDVDIELQALEVGVTVVMQSIFYETAKFDLLDESKTELEHLVKFMKLNPKVKIEIGGHTDDVGSAVDNQRLSEQRAGQVRSYMTGRGIQAGRIVAKGYGEDSPMTSEMNEEGRALNRRTECRITEI